jgi:hypothetical protein
MKLKPTLPENTFELNTNSLPTSKDTDPWGKIMVFRKDVGWSCISLDSLITFFEDLKFTHWTFTPEIPNE